MIYFLEGAGLIKIGHSGTKSFYSRLGTIRSSIPVPIRPIAVIPGCRAEEKKLHDRFESCRSHGEWYRAAPELMRFIDGLLLSGSAKRVLDRKVRCEGRSAGGERCKMMLRPHPLDDFTPRCARHTDDDDDP